ncbi:hypothetical protein [Neobacillus terrae]|uniref:hypothetical protein n=1 Tax=Neobacillus terrae TaxID=3034837 RepID=UPI001408E8FA|nr:hypothetical protein [Neobacillus terrae]NHM33512.1 hypothetical protein [Neobacillus terrae]
MRRRVQISSIPESNPVSKVWIQHLITRLLIGELNIPHRMQAKLLYELSRERKDVH